MTENKPKKNTFLKIIIGLGIFLIIVAIFSGGGSDGEAELEGSVGKFTDTDNFSIMISSVSTRKTVGGMFAKETAPSGAIFIVVNYKYKNISTKPIGAFSVPKIELYDPNNTKYDTAAGAEISYKSEASHLNSKALSDLNPGITVLDANVFEVSNELWKGGEDWKIIIDADKDISVKVK